MDNTEVLKPLKTWSHLSARRRKPSEYEVVSTNLHIRANGEPFELDPNVFLSQWYKKNCDASPLKHPDWNSFRDPDGLIYRTYNMMQDGGETYVRGLFDQFNEREHDKGLSPYWAGTLARLYTPSRYLFHTLQMCSAYLAQMAPASTISLCASFQGADSFRWLSHTAYRTKELSLAIEGKGFGVDERHYWENDIAWQGFRELMERTLTAYDWAECFVALNLVAKPAIEETVLRKLGEAASHNGDTLFGLVADAELADGVRHRRWASALVKLALDVPDNANVIKEWIAKWQPLADHAIDAFCTALPDVPDAAEKAKRSTLSFQHSLFDQ
ncbi:MAG: toluene monooxygenase [Nevskiaceae bacterium]|nr:MAG: toluene monooxygenase [Nevskiaceae bacterium]TBR71959.1 MAG: toluene monooxygenase [Nevskiaceae bacterium]